MPQIHDLLRQTGGLESIARELGISPDQAAKAAETLMPSVLGGFKKQATSQPTGLGALLEQIGGLGGGGLLDEVLAPRPTNVAPGNDILGQIFGSRETSRTLAQDAATRTGLDPSLIKKMLPMVAMLVAGVMARQGGGSAGGPVPPTGGSRGGLGGLVSMLDLDGDGNPLDDLLGMAGKLGR
jgi:hypothetical protein